MAYFKGNILMTCLKFENIISNFKNHSENKTKLAVARGKGRQVPSIQLIKIKLTNNLTINYLNF